MTFQEWRARYSGIKVDQVHADLPVFIVCDRGLPGGPLRDLYGLSDYRVTSDMLKASYGPTVWLAPRVDRDDWTRAEYMDHLIDHESYYLSIARAIGYQGLAQMVRHIAPLDQVVAHVNDLNRIPLARWDGMDRSVRGLITARNKDRGIMARSWSGQPLPAGTICWSLSESVCVLKAVARQMAREAGAVVNDGPRE